MTDKPLHFDVSVASSVDTGVIDVTLSGDGGYWTTPMNYASALILRDMLTDALDHQDKGGHANPSTPIESWVTVSYRLSNILKREGIRTFADLAKLDAHDLLDLRGFGPQCLEEVSKLLTDAGFEAPQFIEGSQHYPYRPGTLKEAR